MRKEISSSSVLLLVSTAFINNAVFAGPDTNGNLCYVSDHDSKNVYQVDTSTNSISGVVSTGSFPSFTGPFGIAIDPNGSFAYVTDTIQSTVYKVNTTNNQVEHILNYGPYPPGKNNMIAISPNGSFGYVGGKSSPAPVYKIDIASNSVFRPLTNTSGINWNNPVVMAISPDNTFAYFTDVSDNLFKVNTNLNTVTNLDVISGIGRSICVTISNNGQKAYVTNFNGNIYQIDTATNTATAVINTGSVSFSSPVGVAYSPDNSKVYVADPTAHAGGGVFVIDTTTNSVFRYFPCGNENHWAAPSIAITSDGLYAYIVDNGATSGTPAIHKLDLNSGNITNVTISSYPAFQSPTWVTLWHTNSPTPPGPTPTPPGPTPDPTLPIFSFNISSFGGNSARTADYLNKYAPQSVLNLFENLTLSEQTKALEAVSPLRTSSTTFTSLQIVTSFQTAITQSLNSQTSTSSASQFAYENNLTDSNEDLMANNDVAFSLLSKKSKTTNQAKKLPDRKNNFWAGGFGQHIYDNPKNQTPSFNASSGGFISGCDYKINNKYPVGGGIAYAYSSLTQDKHMGSGTINQGALFTYGKFDYRNFYCNLSFLGGLYHSDNTRKISFTGYNKRANSETNGWQFAPHLEFGYNYFHRYFLLNPFIMCDDVSSWDGGFKEHGAPSLNMHVKEKYSNFLRGETGLRFQESFSYSWGKLSLLEKLSYSYQKTFGTGSITALLIGSSGSFGLTAFSSAQNLGVGELAVIFDPIQKKYPKTTLNFEAQAGSTFQSYLGSATASWMF